MKEKRPLVWLSAANSNAPIRKALEMNWDLMKFNVDGPAPIPASTLHRAKVGVLDLCGFPDRDVPGLEHWCEALDLVYWVGIVPHRAVKGTRTADLIARYCADFHTMPVEFDRLNTVIGHLFGMATVRGQNQTPTGDSYQTLVLDGDSEPIRQVRRLLRRFSSTLEPVLITGESGTGKDAAAQFLYSHSTRAGSPLITINCAALPDSLTQSELFGYEKGAFTHALKARQGRLEQAHGGSLILSGIDELHLEQQSAILRFLQEGYIERIGGNGPIPVDCRIITTTFRALPDLIAAGRFRSDIYYRLAGLEVRLPTLRDRLEDIPMLANALLDILHPGTQRRRLSANAVRSLLRHSWPGNLRELQNRLRQSLLLSEQPVIEPSDLGLSGADLDAGALSLEAFRARAERQALSCSLKLADHNVSAAARMLRISRVSFYRLLDKHDTGQNIRSARHGNHRKGDPS